MKAKKQKVEIHDSSRGLKATVPNQKRAFEAMCKQASAWLAAYGMAFVAQLSERAKAIYTGSIPSDIRIDVKQRRQGAKNPFLAVVRDANCAPHVVLAYDSNAETMLRQLLAGVLRLVLGTPNKKGTVTANGETMHKALRSVGIVKGGAASDSLLASIGDFLARCQANGTPYPMDAEVRPLLDKVAPTAATIAILNASDTSLNFGKVRANAETLCKLVAAFTSLGCTIEATPDATALMAEHSAKFTKPIEIPAELQTVPTTPTVKATKPRKATKPTKPTNGSTGEMPTMAEATPIAASAVETN
jgi:hypothetical protein